MIKANVDRAVAKAHKEVQEQQAEAEKLRKMNADEKAEFEKNKREEEFKKREAEITRREFKIMLAEKNLSVNFAPYLNGREVTSYGNGNVKKESIHDIAISKVSLVEIPGFNKENNEKLQQRHKYLLTISKNENNINEVGGRHRSKMEFRQS